MIEAELAGEGGIQKSEADCPDEAPIFTSKMLQSLFFPTHIKCFPLSEIPFILMVSHIHPVVEVGGGGEPKSKNHVPSCLQ